MDADRPARLRAAMVRAFDLSERSVRRSRRSLGEGWERLHARFWMIAQCALTAGLAWWLAIVVLGHPMPVFAPVAAVITLGLSFGQRYSRALEVGIGVAIGVLTGDIFVTVAGTGVWQIMVAALIAMSAATLLGARNLMIIQAGVQSIIVLTLLPQPGQGLGRWLDALLGCALAMLIATLAPAGPVIKPRVTAARILGEVASCLRACRDALDARDAEAADVALRQARNSERLLDTMSQAVTEGLAVIRHSPFRRGQRERMEALADLYDPLDRLTRNLRVLARRSAVALWRDETSVPMAYLALMQQVADVADFCAGELFEGRIPTAARARILELARASSRLKMASGLSAVVVLAQLRSMLADLLELTGMSYPDAREAIPELRE